MSWRRVDRENWNANGFLSDWGDGGGLDRNWLVLIFVPCPDYFSPSIQNIETPFFFARPMYVAEKGQTSSAS